MLVCNVMMKGLFSQQAQLLFQLSVISAAGKAVQCCCYCFSEKLLPIKTKKKKISLFILDLVDSVLCITWSLKVESEGTSFKISLVLFLQRLLWTWHKIGLLSFFSYAVTKRE